MGNNPTKKKKSKSKEHISSSSSSSSSALPSGAPSNNTDLQDGDSAHTRAFSTPPPISPALSPVSKSEHSKSLSHGSLKPPDTDKSTPSMKKLEELFEKYKDADGQQIGPEGIESLCKDLGVDPEDVVMLVLAWYLNAQTMGYFKREEFINGFQKLGVDSVSRLKSHLNNFKKDLEDPSKFKDIYRYSFSFAKERDQKILDLAMADALLGIVMGNRFVHASHLRQFLKEQTTYKSVNMDQWMNILEFCRTIKGDLSNYDENGAWPVLLDEYCEWLRKNISDVESKQNGPETGNDKAV